MTERKESIARNLMDADVIIGHGFTVADAKRIAGRAANEHPSGLLSREERCDAGFHAIVEVLLSSPSQAPNLLRAASDAISRAVADERHHRGLSARNEGTAPRFARFWSQPY